jgi:FkbM family methyltransferase
MTGATGNLYCGLHEFNDMGFLLHFLREEDLFVDIGANIGSYTVLASAHVGSKSITIEPVPSTYSNLLNNININNIKERVTTLNFAIGSKNSTIDFTIDMDTVNHVATKEDSNIISVKLVKLDDLLDNKELPTLLKIDVEGYETDVILGADNLLKSKTVKAIIIELNGSGLRYGYDESLIHEKLLNYGYDAYSYNPIKRDLIKQTDYGNHNTIYINDYIFVKNRLDSAQEIIF